MTDRTTSRDDWVKRVLGAPLDGLPSSTGNQPEQDTDIGLAAFAERWRQTVATSTEEASKVVTQIAGTLAQDDPRQKQIWELAMIGLKDIRETIATIAEAVSGALTRAAGLDKREVAPLLEAAASEARGEIVRHDLLSTIDSNSHFPCKVARRLLDDLDAVARLVPERKEALS